MLLAIDIGKGTEDVLIKNHESFENSIQLVLPSTAQLLYKELSISNKERPWFFDGEVMGGEPWHKLVYNQSTKKPESVFMTEPAAKSLKYNLDFVRAKGVNIISESEKPENTLSFTTRDIQWSRIKSIISDSGITEQDITSILICSQEHGDPKKTMRSNEFRMQAIYREFLETKDLTRLLRQAQSIPDTLPRHQANAQSALNAFPHLTPQEVYVMDSTIAVILGAYFTGRQTEHNLIINVGNGHTTAAFFEHGILKLIYETHTHLVHPDAFLSSLKQAWSKQLTHQDVLEQGGHGLMWFDEPETMDFDTFLPFTLIGPNRKKLQNVNARLEHPGGNMMMAGPIGLIQLLEQKQ